uniref:Putative protease n=1 Tax=Podoviridae sp. ctx0K11 TaxID=2825287 RepID=A0A8S5QFP5_9CAUD|nr:MAG TPA: putative protease [Podoviridae sp. ctx0K11]
MTTTNDAPDTPADSKTEVNENPGEKTLGFSSMNEPATEPTEPKADAKAEADKTPPADTKPEEDEPTEPDYSDVKAPDGYQVDAEVMAEITPVLKELKCSKENAEKLVAAGSMLVKRTLEAQQTALEEQHEAWKKEVLADKELGKPENIAIANRAIDTFGDEGLKEITKAGLGNHPSFVRFCLNIGKAISEDSAVISTGSAKASNRNELGEPMLHFKNM